ncbi:DUF819 family protein [Qipengyuania sp. DY56-A-20]|jgi:uncharacterized membrane protein|uniref:DUF819 family protein n=1 Tax=Qipengyuania benthica TaxID=3067651 RepID=A0ABT9H6L4_9SPHN|nr:DUF819 family protein [Qipengyuania sp. DY56-A-20]MBU1254143.1 DUF819 family protein [Alphaproteobacteria bacterium]MBU1607088.1 DUF819 family protein [Alphaproteobacteria bacterium]MDP4538689.1 DUF819 family protein [Qipengyuania sp. DY56-A-20]
MITDDRIILGLLALILGFVFATRDREGWQRFYTFVPIILVCYLVPSLMVTFGLIDTEESNLWPVAKDYFLPAALFLMTLSIDLKGILGLGNKAIIMFLTATVGIILGGPLALWVVAQFDPSILGEGQSAAWRGLATLAGSWIGGGANQTAMLEVYGYPLELFGALLAVDIIVAEIWMVFLLYGAGASERVDRWLGADSSAIDRLRDKMAGYTSSIERVAGANDYVLLFGATFAVVGLSHLLGNFLGGFFADLQGEDATLASSFFWVVVIATTVGLAASFTRARELEGVGASKFGTLFIFVLVAVIGTRMDITKIAEAPAFMAIGVIWMLFHSILLIAVAKAIKAPFFFVAVGSKANVGGAASAPVIASAFHPALAPVGVLLAVLGYALGTYGAILCAQMMAAVG